jgi:tetratricopeptide (TPR) repeat protein
MKYHIGLKKYPTLSNWSDYAKIDIHQFLERFDDFQMPIEYGEEAGNQAFIGAFITKAQLEELKEDYQAVVVVDGNLSIDGEVSKIFYVNGDIECDHLSLYGDQANEFCFLFKPTTIIHARKYVSLHAQDDEVMRDAPRLNIKTPYLLSWFYKLDNLKISSDALIFIMGDDSDCAKNMDLPNPIVDEQKIMFVSPYSEYRMRQNSNEVPWMFEIYDALAQNKPILRQDFDIQSLGYVKDGDNCYFEKDYKAAYLAYKKAVQLSSTYYPAWLGMGNVLYEVGAFSQALQHYQAAADCFPHSHEKFVNEALNFAALCAIRCQSYAIAIELATRSITHNSILAQHDYDKRYLAPAYRLRAEAHYLRGNLTAAIADLDLVLLDLDEYHVAANWLMGLMSYINGDNEISQKFYQQAARRDERFKVPYDQAKDTSFLAKPACTVDWGK